MSLSLKPANLKRYRDLLMLFYKYGHGDLVKNAPVIDDPLPHAPPSPMPLEARELAKDIEKLGPTYIKLAQLLSTRSDMVPQGYMDALSRLQDHVEPFSFDQVQAIVSMEVGARLSKAFIEFDPVPIAAASLGQVHRAVLRSGQQLVVKVQRPDARQNVSEDLEAMTELAAFMDAHTEFGRRYGLVQIVEELRKSLLRELDYRLEAKILHEQTLKSFSSGNLFGLMLEAKEFLEKLPSRLNNLLELLSTNKLRVKVDTLDENLIITSLQKIANRITLGLILASLIIGAALLMRVDTPFRIFGYPGVAMLCFFLAASGGLALAWQIVRSDQSKH